jgi:hypothetical protein
MSHGTRIGCPKKSARFNFIINATFIQKVLIFLFHYKVHTLQLIVEHNIRQTSPRLLSRGGRQCAHFKSCPLLGTLHSYIRMHMNAVVMRATLQLHLRHDFYNIIFKIQHTVYTAPGLEPSHE